MGSVNPDGGPNASVACHLSQLSYPNEPSPKIILFLACFLVRLLCTCVCMYVDTLVQRCTHVYLMYVETRG